MCYYFHSTDFSITTWKINQNKIDHKRGYIPRKIGKKSSWSVNEFKNCRTHFSIPKKKKKIIIIWKIYLDIKSFVAYILPYWCSISISLFSFINKKKKWFLKSFGLLDDVFINFSCIVRHSLKSNPREKLCSVSSSAVPCWFLLSDIYSFAPKFHVASIYYQIEKSPIN